MDGRHTIGKYDTKVCSRRVNVSPRVVGRNVPVLRNVEVPRREMVMATIHGHVWRPRDNTTKRDENKGTRTLEMYNAGTKIGQQKIF